ncbi:MAG: HipA domain-containing protein [Deltaproteobacteria bacterium]|nr:HipA domain-containing protein [Deltaproteobacteria bacterium]
MNGACAIEVRVGGAWRRAAEIHVDDVAAGTSSPSRIEYDFDYLDAFDDALGAIDLRAVSCRHPIGYEEARLSTWPAFLLDLLPSGAARRWWERRLGVPNLPRHDWDLLVRGAGNPPGNVRIAEAAAELRPPGRHEGFERDEVLARGAEFIEYAHESGAYVAGGTGAGGDAPKLLLREDRAGRLHADGALPDPLTAKAWLVKFPRSRSAEDRRVLESEAPYYRVAARLGARVGELPTWERDALFVPRFDRRVTGDEVEHLGLESLYSLAGIADWGAPTPKEVLADALARCVGDPATELEELLVRDVIDVALGNTDNHGRNTAVSKTLDGAVALSPIFDLAPMVLDPQGIARVCRWEKEDGGFPDYAYVIGALAPMGLPAARARRRLGELADRIDRLPAMMQAEGVPADVIALLDRRMQRAARDLQRIR